MKRCLIALFLTLILLLSIGVIVAGNTIEPSTAGTNVEEPIVYCESTQISTTKIRVVCTSNGVIIINEEYNLPEQPPVTLPPVTLPPVTIPNPNDKITIEVPGPTSIITIPGPTSTVTIPGPTRTATERVTRPPKTSTATVKVTETTTGQTEPPRGTIEPDKPDSTVERITKIGLGLLGTLIVTTALILILWSGYIWGQKDARKDEKRFLKGLLSFIKGYPGKHR